MDKVEASGKTVDDALKSALRQLGATMDDVEFTVLDEGKRGFLGRGARDAVVSVERVKAPAAAPAGSGAESREEASGDSGESGRGQRSSSRRSRRGGRRNRRGSGGGSGEGGEGAPQQAEKTSNRKPGGGRRNYEQSMPELSYDDFFGQDAESADGEEAAQATSTGGEPAGSRRRGGRRGQRRPDRNGERTRNRPQANVEPNIDAEEVDMAATIVDDMLRILDIDADISLREPVTPGDGKGAALAVIDISGDELGALIGRRGETLMAMQYLVNLILARRYPQSAGVTIDIEHYRHRREEQLTSLAQRMADRVKQHGTPITLEPMPAAERRLVHLALADDEEIVTNSSGEGENRKVVISLRD